MAILRCSCAAKGNEMYQNVRPSLSTLTRDTTKKETGCGLSGCGRCPRIRPRSAAKTYKTFSLPFRGLRKVPTVTLKVF